MTTKMIKMMAKLIDDDVYRRHGKKTGRILPPNPSDICFDSLDVARIPYNFLDNKPMSLMQLSLVDTDTSICEDVPGKNDSEELEAHLERVPKIDACEHHCSFKWTRRTLVKLPPWRLDTPYRWEDECMMYMCLDRKADLPLNEYLTQYTNDFNVKVYGDAFIFMRVSVQAVKAMKRPRYLKFVVENVNNLYGNSMEVDRPLRKLVIIASEIGKKLSNLDVVRIPYNSTDIETIAMENVPLIGSSTDKGIDSEAQLGRVPDLQYCYSGTFSWNHRRLLNFKSGDLGPLTGTREVDYLMYVCLDERAQLPPNQYLGRFPGAPVYGDAFIFRIEPNGYDESGCANYVHMVESFVLDAKSDSGNSAVKVIRQLMEASSKQVKYSRQLVEERASQTGF